MSEGQIMSIYIRSANCRAVLSTNHQITEFRQMTGHVFANPTKNSVTFQATGASLFKLVIF
jgi:hypothetical protein